MSETETLAAKLADVFYKETEQRKAKWEYLPPVDRSLWRLMARAAFEHVRDKQPE